MADNVEANAGSGGAVFATDDDGTAHWPYAKMAWGADNTQTRVAAGAGAMPIQDGGNSITVDGSLTVDLGANNDVTVTGTVDLGATDNAVLDSIAASVAAIDVDSSTIIGHLDGVEALLTTIDADTSNLSVVGGGTEAAAIRVTIASDSTGVLSIDDNGGVITVDGTVTAELSATDNAVLDNIDADLTTIIGHVDGIEALLGTIDADTSGIITAVQIIDNPVLVDDAAFTPAASSVMMAGFEADETASDSVDEGDAGAARMTLDRKQIVTMRGHATGGATLFKNIDVDETEDAISASACTLYSIYLFNSTNAILFVKLYNATTANVTVGTTVPDVTIPVPGNNDTDGAGVVLTYPMGMAFSTALTIAATTGVADNDTGAPAANAIIASGTYV